MDVSDSAVVGLVRERAQVVLTFARLLRRDGGGRIVGVMLHIM